MVNDTEARNALPNFVPTRGRKPSQMVLERRG